MTQRRSVTRRRFLAGAAGSTLGLAASGSFSAALASGQAAGQPPAAGENQPFSLFLLGDVHFDRLDHHDMVWLAREKPNDVHQVMDYSRITREITSGLFREVHDVIAGASNPPVAFVAQLGDFVEGLAGTPALARKQDYEALAMVAGADLNVPFLITKGNHDITGPGAPEAYADVFLPFLSSQLRREVKQASFIHRQGNALFAFFDAYDQNSLPWLEQTLERERARHVFVLLHPPVVPYAARSLWHLYAKPEQFAERKRLLNVLGKHRAIVLTAHLHRYGVVVRDTDAGPFLQVAVISVIPEPERSPRQETSGLGKYGPDLVTLEPQFEPQTEAARREALRAERPFIRYYEYADAPGYMVLTVDGPQVTASVYTGLSRRLWKTLNLTELLRGAPPRVP